MPSRCGLLIDKIGFCLGQISFSLFWSPKFPPFAAKTNTDFFGISFLKRCTPRSPRHPQPVVFTIFASFHFGLLIHNFLMLFHISRFPLCLSLAGSVIWRNFAVDFLAADKFLEIPQVWYPCNAVQIAAPRTKPARHYGQYEPSHYPSCDFEGGFNHFSLTVFGFDQVEDVARTNGIFNYRPVLYWAVKHIIMLT